MAFNCARTGIGISALWFSTSMGTIHYWYWHAIMPILVMALLHVGSVLVWTQFITDNGIQLCQYRYWHLCILVRYQYWHIPLPELAFVTCARTGIGISAPWFSTSIGTYHYQNWHSKMVPDPGIGIVSRWFITGMGIVRYWYRHLILPVPVLAFLHLGSLPVQAQSITRIGIQKWCPYQYWHFCTLVQYQYGHISLPELGSQHGARTVTGIFALKLSTSIGTVYYRYWHSVVPVSVLAFWHFGSVPVWTHTITGTGVLYGPYRYWQFCTSVQYRYRHIPLLIYRISSVNGSTLRILSCSVLVPR